MRSTNRSILIRDTKEQMVNGALAIMKQWGRELTAVKAQGRAKKYQDSKGKTVKLRVSLNRTLMVRNPLTKDGNNTVDTHYNLVVMPKQIGSKEMEAYLLPSEELFIAIKKHHEHWLKNSPNATTDKLGLYTFSEDWLSEDGFKKHLLPHTYKATVPLQIPPREKPVDNIQTEDEPTADPTPQMGTPIEEGASKQGVINKARKEIADHFGISPSQVEIKVAF